MNINRVIRRIAPSIAATLVLAACDNDATMRRLVPRDADARARAYLGLFVRGQVDSAADRLLPPEARSELGKISDIFRNERFDTTRIVGMQVTTINGVRHVGLEYELHSSFSWFIADVATVDSANHWFVEGVGGRTIAEPLEETTRFTLRDRSFAHYGWLGLTMASLFCSLGVAVFLGTRRHMPKHWLWALFALLGLGTFNLNWTTGAIGVNLLYVQLLSASVVRHGPAAPWILSFAIPAGAIAGLLQYLRWHSGANASAPEASAPHAAIQ